MSARSPADARHGRLEAAGLPRRLASCALVAGALCVLPAPQPHARAEPTPAASSGSAQEQSSRVLSALPARPDPNTRYVIYLHGAIVEDQGRRAHSPRFGDYALDAILAALRAPGRVVVSELRPAGTRVAAYARGLVAQLRRALAAGVPASQLSIVGASKGGFIAREVSRRLPTAGIGYVLLGSCTAADSVVRRAQPGRAAAAHGARAGGLHGDVLSIFEQSDDIGHSCAGLFARSPELGLHGELRLQTGLRHGFLYRPIGAWLSPTLSWIDPQRRPELAKAQ